MKLFVSLALFALLAQSTVADLQSEFLSWKASPAGRVAYENGYVPRATTTRSVLAESIVAAPSADELARFQNAKETIAKLQREQPHAVFSLATPFALLTASEFKAFVGKTEVPATHPQHARALLTERSAAANDRFDNATSSRDDDAVATRNLKTQANVIEWDWSQLGCVSAPIDQGQCQASWAIAAVGALEAAHCINIGALVKLSSQDVISCGTNGEHACAKGVSARAFDWVSHLNGGRLCTDESFPYTSSGGAALSCPKNADAGFACTNVDIGANFYEVQNFRDHKLLEAVVRRQPVAALVNTGTQYFQYLAGGVLTGDEAACPSARVDSSVLIVGLGSLNGVDYWKIRNSWSTYWGDGGYAYIERGFQGAENGACGIETLGYYPVVTPASSPAVNLRCSAIREHVEVTGATLTTVRGVLKPQDCCDQCRRASGCKGFVWRYESDACELKASVTGEQANAPDAGPTYSGTVMTRTERIQQGTILNNVDFPGNDLFATRAGSAEDCLDKCNESTNCHAFTWTQALGGSCYLKTKRAADAPYVPPNADGSSSVRSGTSYKCSPLLSNTDLVGADLSGVPGATVNECCGICRMTDKCGAFTWSDYNGGTCWLKQAGATTTSGVGVVSAFVR